MEDTLRVVDTKNCNREKFGLNPCFNGRYSQRSYERNEQFFSYVLILVLMEDTLRDIKKVKDFSESRVLILVLMEDTLRAITSFWTDFSIAS